MQPCTIRGFEIAGDLLTLLGSLVLASEAFLRKRTIQGRRADLSTSETLREGGMQMVDALKTPVTEKTLEDREATVSRLLAIIGALLLVAGFGFLLATKIWPA